MKTYEVWADIVECEDAVQIDDVGEPALMGTFATQDEAEEARIRMWMYMACGNCANSLSPRECRPLCEKNFEDILKD